MKDPPPNARALHQVLGRPISNEAQEQRAPSELTVRVKDSPFLGFREVEVPLSCDEAGLGFQVTQYTSRARDFLSGVTKGSTAAGMKNWKRMLIGT